MKDFEIILEDELIKVSSFKYYYKIEFNIHNFLSYELYCENILKVLIDLAKKERENSAENLIIFDLLFDNEIIKFNIPFLFPFLDKDFYWFLMDVYKNYSNSPKSDISVYVYVH